MAEHVFAISNTAAPCVWASPLKQNHPTSGVCLLLLQVPQINTTVNYFE